MDTKTTITAAALTRWAGAGLVLAGLLLGAFGFLHPNHDPEGFRSLAWAPVHFMPNLALMLVMLTLPLVYARQMERSGVLGLAGLLISFFGAGLMLMMGWIEVYIIPFLGLEVPQLIENAPAGIGTAGFTANLLFTLGAVVFGLATYRAGVLPRGAAMLLMAGAPIGSYADPLISPLFGVPEIGLWMVGFAVEGAGLAWLGQALWARPAARRGAVRPAAATVTAA